MYPGVISAARCLDFLEWAQRRGGLQAATVGGVSDVAHVDRSIRDAKVSWPVTDTETHRLVRDAETYALRAQGDLRVILGDRREWQFSSYETGERYDPHIDMGLAHTPAGTPVRKLAVVVQLTDPALYVGGDLGLHHVEQPDPEALRSQGTVICFPSFVVHGVSPVQRGRRFSLVGWIHGPEWR